MKSLVLAGIVTIFAGCDDSPPPPCQYAGLGIANVEYRNPATGLCESINYPCDPVCGAPCAGAGEAPSPNWAMCYGACEGLDESQCLASTSCHAAYQDSTAGDTFWGCWELPPSGPLHGTCTNLDAETCSRHDDCTSHYNGPLSAPSFASCQPEPAPTNACSNVDCGTGNICVIQPTDPSTAHCVTTAAAGNCGGLTCQQPPPTCPANTTPGIGTNGCYTSYCIPIAECPMPLCSTLATEQACLARADCDPIYTGINCTCDPHGCTCQSEVWKLCQ